MSTDAISGFCLRAKLTRLLTICWQCTLASLIRSSCVFALVSSDAEAVISCALSVIVLSGLFSSCATPAISSPSADSFSAWIRCSCAAFKSPSDFSSFWLASVSSCVRSSTFCSSSLMWRRSAFCSRTFSSARSIVIRMMSTSNGLER